MKPGYYFLDNAQSRKNSAVAAIMGGVLVALILLMIAPVFGTGTKGAHVAIAGDLFVVGKAICSKNDGLLEIAIEDSADMFTFRCRDGLSLRDTIVRVK